MRRVKQFLLVISGVSLFFIAGCTTMQNIPYDDVYYSTAKGAPKDLVAQNTNTTRTEQPAHYKIVKVEAINTSGQNKTASVDQKQEVYKVDTLHVDTLKTSNVDSVAYSKINTGLGFNNPDFGTGFSSWSLGGYAGAFGYNIYGYDPYWYNFYFPYSYPYYGWNWGWNSYYNWYPYSYGGWGLYGFGYPYGGFGFNYPYYGYSGYYGYYGYPNYYSPYRYWHRNRYYGHRGSTLEGSHVSLAGGGAIPFTGTTKSARAGVKPSGIRPSAIKENTGTKSVARPVGSMRYQKALNNAKAVRVANNGKMLQKPPAYRSTNHNVPQYQRPAYKRPNMATPRYQKPKQYQSLDTRQARSSTEYFRPQPQTVVHGKTTRVNTNHRAQRFNVYRPANTRTNQYRRPVYRNSWNRTTRSTPVRHYSVPRYNSRPNYNNGGNVRRSYNPVPVRVPTGGGGGGGHRGGGGGGGSGHRR